MPCRADEAYDHRRCRRGCCARGVAPRIARRGIEGSQELGRHRWAVERTFAWLALVCLHQISWFCWMLLDASYGLPAADAAGGAS